jgi:hypothetical protein
MRCIVEWIYHMYLTGSSSLLKKLCFRSLNISKLLWGSVWRAVSYCLHWFTMFNIIHITFVIIFAFVEHGTTSYRVDWDLVSMLKWLHSPVCTRRENVYNFTKNKLERTSLLIVHGYISGKLFEIKYHH